MSDILIPFRSRQNVIDVQTQQKVTLLDTVDTVKTKQQQQNQAT